MACMYLIDRREEAHFVVLVGDAGRHRRDRNAEAADGARAREGHIHIVSLQLLYPRAGNTPGK